MRFAIANGGRSEASSGLVGTCPVCSAAVIAKCGETRAHHWAHRADRNCDSWWEPETNWHRAWKSNFPADWQEVIQYDDVTGEKHIADIRTDQGIAIEFQHSHLSPHERRAREQFYGDLIWVVDGTRLKRDLPRFLDGMRRARRTPTSFLFLHPFPKELFSANWLESSVPVFFDFGTNFLFCLLPKAEHAPAVVRVTREEFVRIASTNPKALLFGPIHTVLTEEAAKERARERDLFLRDYAMRRRAPRRRIF